MWLVRRGRRKLHDDVAGYEKRQNRSMLNIYNSIFHRHRMAVEVNDAWVNPRKMMKFSERFLKNMKANEKLVTRLHIDFSSCSIRRAKHSQDKLDVRLDFHVDVCGFCDIFFLETCFHPTLKSLSFHPENKERCHKIYCWGESQWSLSSKLANQWHDCFCTTVPTIDFIIALKSDVLENWIRYFAQSHTAHITPISVRCSHL